MDERARGGAKDAGPDGIGADGPGMGGAGSIDAGPRPRTRGELARWLGEWLGLRVPDEAIVDGHSPPFDYLWHAYEETEVPRDCVVWANRGGGKTFLAAVATLLDLVFKPGIEVRVLGGSLEQARHMHSHLRNLFGKEDFAPMVDGRITERRIRLVNGSCVELLAQSQTSVRGTRVQKLRCDEVELFDPEVWEAAQLVTREKRCGDVYVPGSIECLSTMHVPHGIMHRLVREAGGPVGEGLPGWAGACGSHESADGHAIEASIRKVFRWGVVDVLGRCGPRHACETCTLRGECGGRAKARDERGGMPGHVSVGEAVRLKRRVGEATWNSEMLCVRPRRTDSVLPEFDAALHVIACEPAEDEGGVWIAGVDFGIRAPTVIVWARVDSEGVVRVMRESSVAGEVLARHAERLTDPEGPTVAWVGVDPAGRQRNSQTGRTDVQQLKAAGLEVRDRSMGIEAGLELVRARLRPAAGEPRLFVHERCRVLIESLEKYRYPSDKPEATEPIKDGSDHAVDALRYMIQNLDRPYRTAKGRYM